MRTDRWVRRLHGLVVDSGVEIGGLAVDRTEPIDIGVEVLADLDPPPGQGRVILSYDFPNGQTVRAVEAEDRTVLVQFSDVANFRLDLKTHQIGMSISRGAEADRAVILLEGWVMSMMMIMLEYPVFHASAVEIGADAVALLAHSGMGKSTVTAMLCRDGGKLISDDVLRIERRVDGGFVCHPGIDAIRLRPTARDLAEVIPQGHVEKTPDERLKVRLARSDARPVELAAVLIPVPSRDANRTRAEWLSRSVAAYELNAYPRVYEWKIRGPSRQHFELASQIAASVPVGFLIVPWGPPWPSDLLDDVAGLVAGVRT